MSFLEIQTKRQDKYQLVVSAIAKGSGVQFRQAVIYNVNEQRKLSESLRRIKEDLGPQLGISR